MSSGRDPRRRAALAALAALVACKGSPQAADEPAEAKGSAGVAIAPPQVAPPQVAPPLVAPRSVVLDEPVVELPRQEAFTLLDPGKGARAVLRYALAPGTASYATATDLTARHLAGARDQPPALPRIRDGFAVTIAADHPDRLTLRGLAGDAARSTPETERYLAPWRALLQDRTATLRFDARGAISAIELEHAPSSTAAADGRGELVQRLLARIVPVPEEPVGDGASWRVVTILRLGPAYAKQTATYTLVARGAAGWKLHLRLVRVAEPQAMDDPTLPAGATVELLGLSRTLDGEVECDPGHPLITRGTLAIESRVHVRLSRKGEPATEQVIEDTGTGVFSLRP